MNPNPSKNPIPPLTVGGSGEKHTLKVTAKYADRFDWGYLPSIELYKHKLEVLENHCKAVGRDFAEIEKSCWPGGQIVIAHSQRELDEKIEKLKPKATSMDEFKKTALTGTPDECVERLQEYVGFRCNLFYAVLRGFAQLGGVEAVFRSCCKTGLEVAPGNMRQLMNNNFV